MEMKYLNKYFLKGLKKFGEDRKELKLNLKKSE